MKWKKWLMLSVFCHNNKIQDSIEGQGLYHLPFLLLFLSKAYSHTFWHYSRKPCCFIEIWKKLWDFCHKNKYAYIFHALTIKAHLCWNVVNLWKNNWKCSIRFFFFKKVFSLEKRKKKKNSLIKLIMFSNFMHLWLKMTSEICHIGDLILLKSNLRVGSLTITAIKLG